MIGTGKSAGTINQYIKRFKGFLRWAYQNDYLRTSDIYEKLTYLKDTPYLFEGLDDERTEYRAYNKYLKNRSRAVLGREITPHALKHTHTSLLAAAGVPFDVISRRLGHENSAITREIYFHITGGLRLADASKMSKVSLLAVGVAVGNASEPRKIRHVQ